MKPIKLKLSGLNSYIENQEVDFEKLIERGLFGIFGPTGSGKSTILDAITIAMYGQIPRNTKEFINSLSDNASVSYEFEIGRGSLRRRFIIDRNIKRKKDGGYQTTLCRIVEIYGDGNKEVLADKATEVNKKVADIIGLTSEDFTRSVVLPQGKFNDFLKLTGSDRRNMLERIFGLEKYGRNLTDKIRKRKNKQNEVLNELKGKLSQYDNVTEKLYEETENDLKNLKLEESRLREESVLLENEYIESKSIYETQMVLSKYTTQKENLDTKTSDINNKKQKLENAKKAVAINPYIESVNKLEKDINSYEHNIENIKNELNLIQQSITITDKHYNEAYNKKNNEIPVLLKNQEKLEYAIKLEEIVEKIESELHELRNKYNIEISQKARLENEFKNLASKREIVVRKMKDIESNIDKINISADLKQNIYEGSNIEKEYNNIIKDKKEKETKLENIKKELQITKTNYERTSNIKKDIDIKVGEFVEKQIKLENTCPGDSNLILSKNEELMNLKTKLQQANENQNKKDELQKSLTEILDSRYKYDREIQILSSSIETKEKNIGELEKDLEKLRYLNLASGLAKELKENNPCPVCGSTHHPNLTSSNKDIEIAQKQERLAIFKEELSSLKVKLDYIKPKNAVYISQEQSKNQELETIKSKLKGIDIGELSNCVNLLQNEVILLKNKIDEWDKSKKEVDSSLVKYREDKYKIDQEEVKLHQTIDSDSKTLNELKVELENINKKHDELKDTYNGYKYKLQIENISQKLEQININEKRIEELRITFNDLNKQRESYDENINGIQENIQKHNTESIMLKEVGSEKRRQKEQNQNELLSITKGTSAKTLIEKVIDEISIINKNEESMKLKLESEKIQETTKISERDKIEERLRASKEHLKIQSETLHKLIVENKFSDVYKVMQCLMDKDIMDNMEKEIKLYEEEYQTISLNIANLKEKLNGKNITEEKYKELEIKLNNFKNSLNEKTHEIGSKQERLNSIREALEKVKDISKNYEQADKKMDLLNELDKVTQGNKFVEYVATNQLKYIAIEASKRLKNITKGRYALELDGSGNFIMRDDFNGGVRRSVDTLSGGETFLTSLSLALALSSQIQLKGSAPLEFFFLDEGFGTLDSDLLEIVMQSLERLHSDKLSVGIISHVEELKNRVPVKLVVTSSESGYGSKVQIEYS